MPRRPPPKARRRHTGPALLGALLAALLSAGCDRRSADDPAAPTAPDPLRRQLAEILAPDELNVILVTIDTLRADRVSAMSRDSRPGVETPALDRLAADGILFINAATTVPFTLPAHSSIMTGTYPPFHGVRENVGYHLGEENRTLAQMLGAAGWQTAGFVSAFVLDARWGIGRGFDHYLDDFDLAAFESANLGSVQRPGTETVAAALDWIDQRDVSGDVPRPFFLWLHLYDPHDPYTPPEPYRSRYPGRPYDGEVAYTDSIVGGFLEALSGRGLLERSAVVVTSDHGEGLGDHGETYHGYFVYDSTIHVPLILRLPAGVGAGSRIQAAVSHVDIAPTVLELTGQEIPASVQGRSLLGLAAPGAARGDQPMVYSESFYPLLHYGWAPVRSVRTASHKLIEAPRPELFDLTADPAENRNLVTTEPRLARAMARSLLTLAERLEEGATASAAPDLDEQTLAQLQALGYLGAPADEDVRDYDPSVPRADPKDKIHLHRTLMRAQSMIGAGREDEAVAALSRALEEDPALLDAHQFLGNIELEAGRAASAAEHFERALALDPRHKPSLFGLATAHRRVGRPDDALVGYRRLLEIAGQDSKTTLAIADIEVERGNLGAAEEALRQAAEPGAPALLFNRLGEVRALTGRLAQARRDFEQALAANPRLSQPHFNLAILCEGEGDTRCAQEHYERAIEKAPRHYQAQFNLARLMGALGDTRRERELLEQAIESKADFAIGHFFLGKSLMDGNELERAEDVTRAGLAILEESQLGWFVLADILNRRGRPAEAATALARGQKIAASRGHSGS